MPMNANEVDFDKVVDWWRDGTFNYNEEIPYFHEYNWKKNRTYLWDCGDNRDVWNDHLKNAKAKSILENAGWLSNYDIIKDIDSKYNKENKNEVWVNSSEVVPPEALTYYYNNHGFRTSDPYEGDGIMLLGCSLTYGTGMHYNDIWPVKISKELDLNCWNFGMPGAGHDACYTYASYWLPILKPKYVCMLGPNIRRRSFVDINHKVDIYFEQKKSGLDTSNCLNESRMFSFVNLGTVSHGRTREIREYFKHYLIHELSNAYQSKTNAMKNIDAIRYLCNKNGVTKFVYLYSDSIEIPFNKWFEEDNFNTMDSNDVARELGHPGPLSHNWITKYFLEQIQ